MKVLLLVACLSSAWIDEVSSASPLPERVAFIAPDAQAPLRRVGGISRGDLGGQPQVAALAPEQAGLTVEDQPTLYWFSSQPIASDIVLTLIDRNISAPILEYPLKGIATAGIHRFRLRDTSVHLESNIDYEWSVAIVTNPEERSRDILSSGAIRRIGMAADLSDRLQGQSHSQRAAILASSGVWYDALEELSDAIDADPDNRALRTGRADLLDQVSLKDVAVFERH